MKRSLLPFLCCPACRRDQLALEAFRRDGDEVVDGALRCPCGRVYWIVAAVPRMLGPELYQPPPGWHVAADAARGGADAPAAGLEALKAGTRDVFGHEWTEWGRYGWGEDRPTEDERSTFYKKTLFAPGELAGKVVLDAGCGNGRYTYWAAEEGAAAVIAVDLGAAVDAARANVRQRPNVHVVQGDLFQLPIRAGILDAIFSIGVLMLTGDARRAAAHLASLLGPRGVMSAHVYHKGNPIYEMNDALLRRITTRLTIDQCRALCRYLGAAGKTLQDRGVLGYVNLFLRIHPDETCNFDWYAPPHTTHHTYPELHAWYHDFGLEVVADGQGESLAARRPATSLKGKVGQLLWRDWVVTVKGEKRSGA